MSTTPPPNDAARLTWLNFEPAGPAGAAKSASLRGPRLALPDESGSVSSATAEKFARSAAVAARALTGDADRSRFARHGRLARAKLRLALRSAIDQIRDGEYQGALLNLGYAFAMAGTLFDLDESRAAFDCGTKRTQRVLRTLQRQLPPSFPAK